MTELFIGEIGSAILGGLSGGGSTEVRQTLKSLNEIITSVMMKSVKSCSSSVNLNQKVKIIARRGAVVSIGDINFDQIATLNANCSISSSQKNEILTEIEEKLRAHANAQTGPLSRFLNGNFEADIDVDVTSKITNAIEQVDISKCINNMALKQQFDIEAEDGAMIAAGAIDMKQVADATSKCILNSDQFVSATQKLFKDMDTETTSDQEGPGILDPFGFLDDITTTVLLVIGGVLGLTMLIIIIAIAIVLIRRRR